MANGEEKMRTIDRESFRGQTASETAASNSTAEQMLQAAVGLAGLAEDNAGVAEDIADRLHGQVPSTVECDKPGPTADGTYNGITVAHSRINTAIDRIHVALDRIKA